MKVKELIARLQAADPEAFVLLPDIFLAKMCGESEGEFGYYGEQSLVENVEVGWCDNPVCMGDIVLEHEIGFSLNRQGGSNPFASLVPAVRLVAYGDGLADPATNVDCGTHTAAQFIDGQESRAALAQHVTMGSNDSGD